MNNFRFVRGSTKLLLALILIGLNAGVSAASERLVGTWYGEIADAGQYVGIPYDMRRWVAVYTQDGSARLTMRYYLGSSFQIESTEHVRWGIENNIYWTQCISVRDDNGMRDCASNPRTNYTLHLLDRGECRYTSQSSGRVYLMRRASRDFTLPM